MAALLAIGVIGAGVAFATAGSEAPLAPGTARLIPGDAAVTVHRGTPGAAADALLRAGDSLVVDSGVVTLKTTTGTLTALAGSALAITAGAPRITRGDVLASGKSLNVAMRAATAEIDGIARIRQGLSLEVAVYRGGAVVRTVTETLVVPRLRRAIVAGNGGPATVTLAPLVLAGSDEWDRRFLGSAIELDAALTARSRGLTSLAVAHGADVVGKVVASTGWKSLSALPEQPIGEWVVAAELARAADLGPEAVAAALKLRAEGAAWGLIALEQGLHALPAAFAGIDEVAVPVVQPVVSVPDEPAAPTTDPVLTTPVTTPKLSTPQPNTTAQPPVTVPPAPTPPPSNPVAGLVEGLDNLLGGLLGGTK